MSYVANVTPTVVRWLALSRSFRFNHHPCLGACQFERFAHHRPSPCFPRQTRNPVSVDVSCQTEVRAQQLTYSLALQALPVVTTMPLIMLLPVTYHGLHRPAILARQRNRRGIHHARPDESIEKFEWLRDDAAKALDALVSALIIPALQDRLTHRRFCSKFSCTACSLAEPTTKPLNCTTIPSSAPQDEPTMGRRDARAVAPADDALRSPTSGWLLVSYCHHQWRTSPAFYTCSATPSLAISRQASPSSTLAHSPVPQWMIRRYRRSPGFMSLARAPVASSLPAAPIPCVVRPV